MGSYHSALWQHYSDGYTEHGSMYYGSVAANFKTDRGQVHKYYKIRLKFYDGKYDNSLRYFKLHGSIDCYVLRNPYTNEEVRVKRNFGVDEFYIERFDETVQKYDYERPHTEPFPDVLTGTTEKLRQYNNPFYDALLNHFKANLLESSKLIVVGYGFQDKGINDYIEKYFLVYNKPMIVVDIQRPESEILKKYESQIQFMLPGVTGHSYEEYIQVVGLNH